MANVTLEHQAPLAVLRQHPEAVLELLRLADPASDRNVPTRVQVVDTELAEAIPSARRADLVAILRDDSETVRQVVIVEIQRDRDDQKLFAWPLYIAHLYAEYQVPTTLLVITFDTAVTSWARAARSAGPNLMVAPSVLGPEDFPEIASIEHARANPELSMLTALARLSSRDSKRVASNHEEIVRVFEAMLRIGDDTEKSLYVSMLQAIAKGALYDRLDKLAEDDMDINELIFNTLLTKKLAKSEEKGKEEGLAKGKEEGLAEGEALAVLKVVRSRGLHLDGAAEARIRDTRDLALLDRWLERALTANTVEELLAD